MAWQQLSIDIGDADTDLLEQTVEELGALSVTYTDAGDQAILEPPPGQTPLWKQTRLMALFSDDTDIGLVTKKLHNFGTAHWTTLEDREWVRAWMDDFEPMCFGEHLWVCPHNQRAAAAADDTVIYLDPGLAFGTGKHTTTELCLEWLAQNPPAGAGVIDFGCGSGILAIAAAKLGACQVDAIDIDEQALLATRDNATANKVGQLIRTFKPGERQPGAADLVVANILAGPLVELAPELAMMTRSTIVLSGVLDTQTAEVAAAYQPWFEIDQPTIRAGWARIVGRRRDCVHPVS